MNEEARELAEKWGCTPSNTCYWYCVEAAQCEIDDDKDILDSLLGQKIPLL